jgi:hypothetical protein
VLGRSDITPESTFASLDGDSLTYVMAYMATEKCIGDVPADWAQLTIRELASRSAPVEQPTRHAFVAIDSTMIVRAGAIVAVVATHEHLMPLEIGPTTALLFVSGYIFGKMQLTEAMIRRSVTPIVRTIRSVALVTAIYTMAAGLFAILRHRTITFSTLFLSNDLVDYEGLESQGPVDWGRLHIHLWYIHDLIHIMLVVLALTIVGIRLRLLERNKAGFAIGILLAACLARWAWPVWSVITTGHWELSSTALQRWLPSTNFATFFLGAMVGASLFRSRMHAGLAIAAQCAGERAVLWHSGFGDLPDDRSADYGLQADPDAPGAVQANLHHLRRVTVHLPGSHLGLLYSPPGDFSHDEHHRLANMTPFDTALNVAVLALTLAVCVAAWACWNKLQRLAIVRFRKLLAKPALHRSRDSAQAGAGFGTEGVPSLPAIRDVARQQRASARLERPPVSDLEHPRYADPENGLGVEGRADPVL